MYKQAPINNDIKVSSKDRNKLIYDFHKERIQPVCPNNSNESQEDSDSSDCNE